VSDCCFETANERKGTFYAGRILGWLTLAFGLCASLCTEPTAQAETPAGDLQKQAKPVFKEGHGLPRLDYLRNGDLLPGPNMHVWSKSQPAYELPTDDEDVRVVARKHQRRQEWLVTAWAAAGDARDVAIEIPELGQVQLHARPPGPIYIVEGTNKEDPMHALIDEDPMLHLADVDVLSFYYDR
jgi:hypothetical protein